MKRIISSFLALASLVFLVFSANAAALTVHSQVVSGDTSVYLGDFIFSTDIEGIRIESLRFYNAEASGDEAVESLELWYEDTLLATSPLLAHYAEFNNFAFTIPRNGKETLTLRGNFNTTDNVSGSKIRMILRGDTSSYVSGGDMIAVGLDSGWFYDNSTSYLVSGDSVETVQHVYDSRLVLEMDSTQPEGFQGMALGDEIDLFNFRMISDGGNSASNPRETYVKSLTLTVSGDAHVTDIALYGPSDSFRDPIAAAPVDHVTAPTYAYNQTVFTLNLSGRDAFIPFGSTKRYKLKGRVSAEVDANAPSRSLRISIADLGTADAAGDVVWYDNGDPIQYVNSQRVDWVDSDVPMLRPSLPMSFGMSDPGFIPDVPDTLPADELQLSSGSTTQSGETDDGIQLTVSADGTELPPEDDVQLSSGSTTQSGETDDGIQLTISTEPGEFASPEVIDMYTTSNPFPDVFVGEIDGFAAVDLYLRDIISGYPDGFFHGENFVNRVETLKFLLTARYSELPDMPYDGRFPDVSLFAWYAPYVVHGVDKGIVQGYPDGLFRPDSPVLTVEFLKMLTLTFDLEENLPYTFMDVSPDDWFAPYVGIVEKYNLFPHLTDVLEPGKQLTRYEVATAMFQILRSFDQMEP